MGDMTASKPNHFENRLERLKAEKCLSKYLNPVPGIRVGTNKDLRDSPTNLNMDFRNLT